MVAVTVGQLIKIIFTMMAAYELRSHVKRFSRSHRNIEKLIIKLNSCIQRYLIKYMHRVESACLVFEC